MVEKVTPENSTKDTLHLKVFGKQNSCMMSKF